MRGLQKMQTPTCEWQQLDTNIHQHQFESTQGRYVLTIYLERGSWAATLLKPDNLTCTRTFCDDIKTLKGVKNVALYWVKEKIYWNSRKGGEDPLERS